MSFINPHQCLSGHGSWDFPWNLAGTRVRAGAAISSPNGIEEHQVETSIPQGELGKLTAISEWYCRACKDKIGFNWIINHTILGQSLILFLCALSRCSLCLCDYYSWIFLDPKKNSISLLAVFFESDAWTVFSVLEIPQIARMVSSSASLGSVPPINRRVLRTASLPFSSIATIFSLVT